MQQRALIYPPVHQVDTRWHYNPEIPTLPENWAFDTAALLSSGCIWNRGH